LGAAPARLVLTCQPSGPLFNPRTCLLQTDLCMSTADSITPGSNYPHGITAILCEWVADWGALAIEGISAVGDYALFVWNTLAWMVTRMPRKETLLPNFYQVGVLSLPVVALTGTFIGMVLAVQSYNMFADIGLETRLGGVITL